MFGTEMVASNFWITIFEIIILCHLIFNSISQPKDQSRQRFMLLTLMFILYNIASGLLPDPAYSINLFVQNIIAFGSGILLAIHYYYYLVVELKIVQGKLFNIKALIISLSITFVFGFIVTYTITGDIGITKRYYIVLPIGIALYYCFKTVQFLMKKKFEAHENLTPYKLMIKSGYVGIIFIASMPIVVFFGDYQILNNSLVNVSFLVAFYAYFKFQSYKQNLKHEMFERMKGQFENGENNRQEEFFTPKSPYCLTPRELEIAYLILHRLKFISIAFELNLGEKTISSYASSIYKKTKTNGKKNFIEKFTPQVDEIRKRILNNNASSNILTDNRL